VIVWVEVDVEAVLDHLGITDWDKADSRVLLGSCADDYLIGGLVQHVVPQYRGHQCASWDGFDRRRPTGRSDWP
jgi:hypothetical protein